MDAASADRVSPEACALSEQMPLREPVALGQRGGSHWDGRRATFAKLLCSFFRLSRWDFPKYEGKVPVQEADKFCSLVGPKIPFPVNRPTFHRLDLGVTY